MTVPPRPTTAPNQPGPSRSTRAASTAGAATGSFLGGLSSGFIPPVNVNVNTRGNDNNGGQAATGTTTRKGTPGADFMSNEDIRAFCEHVRKQARNLATERAMDADHLEAVLRTIPDQAGSMAGSRARARRVSRHLKKIAAAEKQIQKYAALLYGTFEREFEADLRTVGKARTQAPRTRQPFGWR